MQESVKIYLPWKSETREIDVRNAKTERVNVAPYVSIVANDSKDMVSQKCQQEDNHVTGKNSVIITKEISRNSKLQRNCPKVKNDVFMELKNCKESKSMCGSTHIATFQFTATHHST